jgi:hypothetical protein
MKVNRSLAFRAGLIGAAAGLVLAVLTRIPFLACLFCWIGPVLSLAIGALYVHLAIGEGAAVDIAEGALGGTIAGAIASAVNSLVSGVLTLVFGTVGSVSNLLGGEGESAITGIVGTIGGAIVSTIVGIIVGTAAGAVGGAVYAAIKGRE